MTEWLIATHTLRAFRKRLLTVVGLRDEVTIDQRHRPFEVYILRHTCLTQWGEYMRVSKEGETLGLDLHEHGISAYPEYVITATPRPAAMVAGEGARAMSRERTAELGTEPAH